MNSVFSFFGGGGGELDLLVQGGLVQVDWWKVPSWPGFFRVERGIIFFGVSFFLFCGWSGGLVFGGVAVSFPFFTGSPPLFIVAPFGFPFFFFFLPPGEWGSPPSPECD